MHKLSLSLLAVGLMTFAAPSAHAIEATAAGKGLKDPTALKTALVAQVTANLGCDRYKARLCSWCPAGGPTCVAACNEYAQTYKECTDDLAKRLKAINDALKPRLPAPCGAPGQPKCAALNTKDGSTGGGALNP